MTGSSAKPAVSVIMSIHDSAPTVAAAVHSVIRQTLTDWELILVDDGSNDGGADRVKEFNDPRINIIRREQRKGLACRLNEAVRIARADIIARMDGDDICYPERLAKQMSFLRSNPTIDLVASKAIVFRGEGRILGVMSPPTRHAEVMSRLYDGVVFPHPTWCGRAGWFQKYRYDERMPITQDQELLVRAAEGSCFASIDEILLGYRKERTSLSKSGRGRLLFSRAVWRHARKSGAQARAAVQIAKQLAKFTAEVGAVGAGAEEWLSRRKFGVSLDPDDVRRWQDVWADSHRCGQ